MVGGHLCRGGAAFATCARVMVKSGTHGWGGGGERTRVVPTLLSLRPSCQRASRGAAFATWPPLSSPVCDLTRLSRPRPRPLYPNRLSLFHVDVNVNRRLSSNRPQCASWLRRHSLCSSVLSRVPSRRWRSKKIAAPQRPQKRTKAQE